MAIRSLFLVCALVAIAFSELAPLNDIDSTNAIENQYILVFKAKTSDKERKDHIEALKTQFAADSFSNQIIFEYNAESFNGFSAILSPRLLLAQRASPLIDYIERDAEIHASQTCQQQNDAVWGINRISEVELSLDGIYRYENTGAGVNAYIIDTGINVNHVEFAGRATWGNNFIGGSNTDCNGHGTHVAGTVGGTLYGVAKQTSLIAVKVLDCGGSGSYAAVIAGVDYVTAQYNAKKVPSLANMSLGGPKSTALDAAITVSVQAGVTYVVAAGNDNNDACNSSPANNPVCISVGATTTDFDGVEEEDVRAYFSNYGTCVTLLAPGELIKSAWIGPQNTETLTISGTSMAAPHTAGAAALYLQANPNATPTDVKTYLVNKAHASFIDLTCAGAISPAKCNVTPNKLLYASCS